MPASEFEKSQQHRVNAHRSWANTVDRTKRTAPARAALEAKFLREADGDPKRAKALRKAYYANLVLKSVQARRRRSEHRKAVEEARIAKLIGVGE